MVIKAVVFSTMQMLNTKYAKTFCPKGERDTALIAPCHFEFDRRSIHDQYVMNFEIG